MPKTSLPVCSAAELSPPAEPGHVYLVGAGPGEPSLLTLRAAHLLATADHILPDDLVSPELLALVNPAAEITPVGKRCGSARVSQASIHELLLESARRGRSVVRLKSGDPLIFGRAGEEIAALLGAGVPFEIVPGISATFAAAASLRTPLTNRASASKLILATGHHATDKLRLDADQQPIWSGPLPADATLALYMPGRNFRALAAELIAAGIARSTPVAAVSSVSRSEEQVVTATLETLGEREVGPAPVLLLVGDAIRPR